jgi:NAD(P)-dependent dehydrogenase (short-subunit alcohol dehydrogenase family)
MTRTVLIGGGAGALGSAVTDEFLASGWRVVVPVRESGSLAEAEGLRTVPADLFEPDSVAEVVGVAAGEPGAPLRAVVNLVGGFSSVGRVHETDVAGFEQQLRLNLRPAYLTTAAALPHLIAAGGGAVVCTSSRAAVRPFSGAAGYITAKAGVLAFVDALAVEYVRDKVRANAIVPNVIDTAANRAAQPDSGRRGWTAPADIAKVVRYLCEDDSATVTGAHLPV